VEPLRLSMPDCGHHAERLGDGCTPSLVFIDSNVEAHGLAPCVHPNERAVDPNTSLTASVIVCIPGEGIRNVIAGNAPNWTGGFNHVVINF